MNQHDIMSKYISDSERLKYFERLIEPYEKKGTKKFFIDQYLHGDGNELGEKFWNMRSSSRFAFDLYSWLAFDEKCIDFEFEYKLPGMASGGKTPNMDVFIETSTEVIFIESKFSECASLQKVGKFGLSEAYWLDNVYGRKKLNLIERYHNFKGGIDFSNFICEIAHELSSNKHSSGEWFDIKQETCHLIGVYLFLQKHPEYKSKKIRLYNIFWRLNDDNVQSPLKKLFHDIWKKYQPNLFYDIDFQYDAFTVQDMLSGSSKISEQFLFPDDVLTRIQPFVDYSKDKTRVEMNRL